MFSLLLSLRYAFRVGILEPLNVHFQKPMKNRNKYYTLIVFWYNVANSNTNIPCGHPFKSLLILLQYSSLLMSLKSSRGWPKVWCIYTKNPKSHNEKPNAKITGSHHYMSVLTLNGTGLNSSIKRQRLTDTN